MVFLTRPRWLGGGKYWPGWRDAPHLGLESVSGGDFSKGGLYGVCHPLERLGDGDDHLEVAGLGELNEVDPVCADGDRPIEVRHRGRRPRSIEKAYHELDWLSDRCELHRRAGGVTFRDLYRSSAHETIDDVSARSVHLSRFEIPHSGEAEDGVDIEWFRCPQFAAFVDLVSPSGPESERTARRVPTHDNTTDIE